MREEAVRNGKFSCGLKTGHWVQMQMAASGRQGMREAGPLGSTNALRVAGRGRCGLSVVVGVAGAVERTKRYIFTQL